jgi:hypothetical protein
MFMISKVEKSADSRREMKWARDIECSSNVYGWVHENHDCTAGL